MFILGRENYNINLIIMILLISRKRLTVKASKPTPSNAAAAESRPQKPFDAIRVYIEEKKEKFSAKYPDLNVSETNRRLTAKYNELSEEKKEKYKKKALALKEQHRKVNLVGQYGGQYGGKLSR